MNNAMPMILFSLKPLSSEAFQILETCDTAFHEDFEEHGKVLSFGHRPSRYPGAIATFGRHLNADIQLPCVDDDSRRLNNYHNTHFFFYQTPSGELILRDESNGHTDLEVHDVSPSEQRLYSLHGSPKLRVIPRTNLNISIVFGTCTRFQFIWRIPVLTTQRTLAQNAQMLQVPGVDFTTNVAVTNRNLSHWGFRALRSKFAPNLAPTRDDIEFHRYEDLGRGSFGTVSKVVDLRTGQLLALKELRDGPINDRLRQSFMDELKTVARLRHVSSLTHHPPQAIFKGKSCVEVLLADMQQPNIAHLEHFQDFRIGGRFQIFFRLCQGSVQSLITSHTCVVWPSAAPSWTTRFIEHVLGGLKFLHDKGILHRDIKAANILFDQDSVSSDLTFYITDFGLSTSLKGGTTDLHDTAGTAFYMAPEAWAGRPQAVSDIWSFAVMLGCVIGYWCHGEYRFSRTIWEDKLRRLGYQGQYAEEEPDDADALYRRWANRLILLAQGGALPKIYKKLLTEESQRITAADCLKIDPMQYCPG